MKTLTNVALVTGGARGLGRELVLALLGSGHTVVTDARNTGSLAELAASAGTGRLITVPGDITDAGHRADLVAHVQRLGRLDVLVNNASTLGETPLPRLADTGTENLLATLETNLLAPHALTTALLPLLRNSSGVVVNVTSDAAVEGYVTWGVYGASKAALEQWTNILGAEEPGLHVYRVDPGDLRTDLHQAAFPGEDISDRPLPEVAVPGFVALVEQRPDSGRYRLQDPELVNMGTEVA